MPFDPLFRETPASTALRAELGIPDGTELRYFRLTGLVTVTLVFLQIRRCPASQRQWNQPLWGVMGFIIGGLAILTYEVITHLPDEQRGRRGHFYADMSDLVVVPQWLPRPLNIVQQFPLMVSSLLTSASTERTLGGLTRSFGQVQRFPRSEMTRWLVAHGIMA